jgi:hypothetical protein
MALTAAEKTVLEKSSAIYTATLKDETGTAIPLASLSTVTLSLHDVATGQAINSRTDQDIKNANNVTIHATSGLLTWIMQTADNAIVGDVDEGELEEHCAEFAWTWGSPTKTGRHRFVFYVQSLTKVT